EGGKLRFRPILMTSFAFIAGLIPLVRATGPGAIGNRTIGTTAVGGMLLGTLVGVLVIPGLYYLFHRLAGDKKLLQDETDEPLSETLEHQELEHKELEHKEPTEIAEQNEANEATDHAAAAEIVEHKQPAPITEDLEAEPTEAA